MTTPAGGTPGSNTFTRKIGPLPLWAWMGLGLGGALAFSQWGKNKKAAAAVPSTGTQTAQNTPPFIIQNYPTVDTVMPGHHRPGTPPPKNQTPTKAFVTSKGDASDNNALNIATAVYGLKSNTSVDATIGSQQIIAANPQIDWARPLPKGTTVNVPVRWISDEFKATTTAYNQGDVPSSQLPPWAR